VVLKEVLKDKLRILTLLTKDLGVIDVVLNASTNLKGPLVGSTGLFCYSSFELFKYKDKYNLDNADLNSLFVSVRSDLVKLSLASYFSQLIIDVAPKGEKAEEFLRLLLNSFYYFEKGTKPLALIKAIFELRIISLAGYMPDLVACAECGCYESEYMFFSLKNGNICCNNCVNNKNGNNEMSIKIVPSVLAAMRHIIYSDFNKLFSFIISDDSQKLLSLITESYIEQQLEKRFTTLDFYKSICV